MHHIILLYTYVCVGVCIYIYMIKGVIFALILLLQIAELECLNSRDFVLVGNRTLECVRLRNGSVSWNSPLPTCHRQTNCPKIQDRNDSGVLELPISAENYYCNWNIDGNEINPTAKYIEFSVKVQPEDLVRTARRNRGLTFYDGERRITVQNGSGLHYRTRDTKLRINFHLTKAEAEFMKDASFRVDYVVVRKTCPTIDEEAFPFGTITLTDSFFIGSQAKLECAPGYDLRGDPEAVCQRDANWTFGNTMPECISLSAEADNDIRLLEEVGQMINVEDEHYFVAGLGHSVYTHGIATAGQQLRIYETIPCFANFVLAQIQGRKPSVKRYIRCGWLFFPTDILYRLVYSDMNNFDVKILRKNK